MNRNKGLNVILRTSHLDVLSDTLLQFMYISAKDKTSTLLFSISFIITSWLHISFQWYFNAPSSYVKLCNWLRSCCNCFGKQSKYMYLFMNFVVWPLQKYNEGVKSLICQTRVLRIIIIGKLHSLVVRLRCLIVKLKQNILFNTVDIKFFLSDNDTDISSTNQNSTDEEKLLLGEQRQAEFSLLNRLKPLLCDIFYKDRIWIEMNILMNVWLLW